jgi:hypothetical protein
MLLEAPNPKVTAPDAMAPALISTSERVVADNRNAPYGLANIGSSPFTVMTGRGSPDAPWTLPAVG